LDSSAVLALFDDTDRFHPAAKRGWHEFGLSQDQLVSTNYVALESFSLLQRRFGLKIAARFQLEMLPAVLLHWVDTGMHEAGVESVVASGRRQLSLVDYTSFLTMRALGIRRFFGFDAHFVEHGFEPVVPFS